MASILSQCVNICFLGCTMIIFRRFLYAVACCLVGCGMISTVLYHNVSVKTTERKVITPIRSSPLNNYTTKHPAFENRSIWPTEWRCYMDPNITRKYIYVNNLDITKKGHNDPKQSFSCNDCFPRGMKLLQQPSGLCDTRRGQHHDDLKVIFIILSFSGDFVGRQAIRHSWASATQANTVPYVRYIFLLGSASHAQEQKKIDFEQARHNDLLQKDIKEDIANTTLKTIMGLEWVSTECQRARYVMKTDTDSFVNIALLMSVLESVAPEVGLFGHCRYDIITIRDRTDKHHEWESYNANYYPPYCFGAGYVLSMDATREVVKRSQHVPQIRMEDSYVALCLRESRFHGGRVFRIHHVFDFLDSSFNKTCCDGCDELHTRVVWHKVTPLFLKKAWEQCFRFNCPA